ncbi:MAG TPA: VOC family protein [Planosporangium sp.]|jgi:hypothetical protein|nr:VOC family protein [Planosporangium sp.]
MIDHLVLAAPDLAATVSDLERLTGVRPAAGGRHPGRGTRNALLGLGNAAYLEIIGVDPDQPHPTQPRPFGLDALTEPRLVTWAVRVDDVDARSAAARCLGFDPGAVERRSRTTTDGQVVAARVTLGPGGVHTGLLPFLVEWETAAHPADALPVAPLTALVGVHPEPDRVRAALRAVGAELEVRSGSRVALIATLRGREEPVVLL